MEIKAKRFYYTEDNSVVKIISKKHIEWGILGEFVHASDPGLNKTQDTWDDGAYIITMNLDQDMARFNLVREVPIEDHPEYYL